MGLNDAKYWEIFVENDHLILETTSAFIDSTYIKADDDFSIAGISEKFAVRIFTKANLLSFFVVFDSSWDGTYILIL